MVDLSFEEICASVRGSYTVREEPHGINLLRFPDSILSYYSTTEHYRLCSQCHPGIRLDFLTDSRTLSLTALIRWIYPLALCIDLYVDGVFRDCRQTEDTSEVLFPSEQIFSAAFVLGETHSLRRITLYSPHLASMFLRGVQLEDGAHWESVPEDPIWLALGDSITQGGTSINPSLVYTSVTARALGLSVHNCGVGGMVFDVESLPERPLMQQPECITVAYGINDWANARDEGEACDYLHRLRELYPAVPLAVLAPVYCTNLEADSVPAAKNNHGQTLNAYRSALSDIVATFPNIVWVEMDDLLPQTPTMLFDRLHPNTVGHQCYGENLAVLLRRAGWEKI